MGRKQIDSHLEAKTRREKPCWKEMLSLAFAGLAFTETQFEHLLDHVERMP